MEPDGTRWQSICDGICFLDSQGIATLLNFVILTAAVSVYNGTSYCSSRMLLGLAQQGNAPKVFARINKRGIPTNAVILSAAVTILCVLLNYIFPEKHLVYS